MTASEQSILSLVRGLSFPRKRESRPDLIGDLDCVAGAQNRAWHVLRLALGALLVTAAVLKTHTLATAPLVGTGLLASRWFVLAVAQVELLVAFWLLAGIWPMSAWRSAIALFGVFGAVSLSKALAGEASCGCFGRVTVSPWLTTALNVGAVFALVGWGAPPPQEALRIVLDDRGVGLRLGLDGRLGRRARQRQPAGGAR
jgi:hypothetical protein